MNIDESRTKKSINNIIGGLMFKLIALIFPFIIKAVMIKKLGVQYLGLNSLFTSILMVLSLSELGVGSALVYSMYKPMAENDEERICALLKVYKKFYRIIGVIISVVGLILLPFLRFLISGTYPKDINIYILYLIYLVNTALSYFLFAYIAKISKPRIDEITILSAAVMWEQDFWKPYVGVVVNIVVNIVLCKTIGVAGVLLSTIIVMVFIYFPWETWALFKYLFKRSSKEYLLRMFFYLIVTIIVALVTDYLCKSINIYGILGLVIKMVICSLLPNIMYLIAYFKLPEFQDGKRRVFNIINSKRN